MSNYILNPQYSLRDDIHRALVIATPSFNTDASIYYIHPAYAFILSLFNGQNKLDDILNKIASSFQISKTEASHVIFPLINNSKKIGVKYGNVVSIFPPQILVDNELGTVREDLSHEWNVKIENLDFSSRRLYRPLNLLICPTLRCYTNCVYCYANRGHFHKELTANDWVNIINSARQSGIERIDVTGGEFYLFNGWQHIANALVSNGYQPEISTKIPLSQKTLLEIKRIGLKSIQFSLDTLNDQIAHETLSVKTGYIQDILNSIRFADRIGLELIIKPTLCRKTASYSNINEIYTFSASLNHIKRVVVSVIGYSCYKSDSNYAAIKPSISQIEEVRQAISDITQKSSFPIHDDTFVYLKDNLQNKDSFSTRPNCSANVEGFVILPDGTATICEELYWNKNFIIGNANIQSLCEIWNSKKALRLWNITSEMCPTNSACKKCSDFLQCHRGRGVCWKLVQWAYGNAFPYMPDPRCPKAPKMNHIITGD